MSAAHTDYLIDVARASAEARHGEKGAIYAAAAKHLSISVAELHRRLNAVTVRPKRKQRADAGTSAMSHDEAMTVAGYVQEHIRRNGKRIKSVDQAVAELRANGRITAGRLNPATGEWKPLTTSAILRALSAYGLHPSQISQPDPVTALESPHPNWCHQVDASLCVIFKMPAENGRRVVEVRGQDAYKNKLREFARIEHLLVQRYLITDHASGALRVFFGLGGESAEGLVDALISAWIEQPGCPMHGAPSVLMLDQASANRSAMVRNLAHSLDIRLSYTMPGNPRSKGQVEGAHNIFERGFESGLKLVPEVADISQLQALGDTWVHWYNGTQVHSRHGMTRYEAWQTITASQLRRIDTDAAGLRRLARSDPLHPKVTPYLTVKFEGAEWDVSSVPEVLVGQKLAVCRSGYDTESALVIRIGDEGRETLHPVPKVRTNALGFREGAARIGEDFKRKPDTPVQTAKKRLELLATGADTLDAAKKSRKANAVPFGGTIDPHQQAKQYEPPAWLPKQGTAMGLTPPSIAAPPLSVAAACKALMARLGPAWPADGYQELSRRYPGGQVPDADLDAIEADLRAGKVRPKLAVVK